MKNSRNNMIEMFKGYTDYNEDEYQDIWESALIVVDTNILLNFYRYSEDTRKEMFKILKSLKSRLWIPYYVAKEYFTNKNSVMVGSYAEYTKLSDTLKETFKHAEDVINKKKNTQLRCKENLLKILEESSQKLCTLLDKEKSEKKPEYKENKIEKVILSLFNNSVGEPFPHERFETIKKEGIRRVENKIPPGYKDNEKEENGDYYIFCSLIEKSKESQKNIIFITDDVKEDWFNIIDGEKHGGRYELLNEFYQETDNLLLIYTSDGFIKAYSKNITNEEINKDVVDELINTRKKYSIINNYNRLNEYAIIDNIRNSISHDTHELKYYLDDLIYLIKRLDVPESQKYKYLNTIYTFKHKNSDGKEYDKKDLLNLLNSIIYTYSESQSIVNRSNNFRNMYIQETQNLIMANDKEEIFSSYRKLIDILKSHLEYLQKSTSNTTYKMQLDLSYILDVIQNTLRQKDDSLSLKKDIIDKLEKIITLI